MGITNMKKLIMVAILLAAVVANAQCIGYTCSTQGWGALTTGAQSSFYVFNPGCNGSLDITTALQSAINAYLQVFIPAQSGYCVIQGSTLTVPSGETLQLAPGVTMHVANSTVAAGGYCYLTNANYSTGNTNITIDGGNWDCNAVNQTRTDTSSYIGGSGFRFQYVTGMTFKNLIITNPLSWSVQPIKIVNALFDNITFNQTYMPGNNDGIHVCGPSSNIKISNLYGNTDDDTTAFSANDATTGACPFYGAISNVIVDSVFSASNTADSVRIVSTNNQVNGVYLHNLASGVAMSTFGYSGGNGNIENVFIDNLLGRTQLGATFYGVTIRNSLVGTGGVVVSAGAIVDHLVVDDVYGFNGGSTETIASIAGTVGVLDLSNVRLTMYGSGGTNSLFETTGSGSVGIANISNTKVDSCLHFFGIASGTTVTTANVVNSTCTATGISGANGFSISGTLSGLNLSNTTVIGAVNGISLANSLGSALRIVSNGFNTSSLSGSALSLGTGNSVSLAGYTPVTTRTLLTPLTNDFVFDSTTGPSWYNGLTWTP